MKIKLNNDFNEFVKIQQHFKKEDFDLLHKTKYINGRKTKVEYLDAISCFDSETSKKEIEKNKWVGWVYQWCMCVNNQYVVGRTTSDFMSTLNELKKIYKLNNRKRMIIYIHNLSYDATYFLRYLYKRDINTRLFCIDSRKILTIECDGFEFRDSYMLSNMSLAKWCEFLKTKTKKAVGAIDYETVRFQDDMLTYNDWYYQINDVACMKECIEIELKENNDSLTTIPLTSTGYVRRDCRNAVKNDVKYRKWFEKTALDEKLYTICREVFAGGYCHANRHMLNQTICKKIGHFDKKSFYPSTQMMSYFPKSKFEHIYKYDEKNKPKKIDFFKKYIEKKCCLIQLVIKNARLKKGVTAPYLQNSKLRGNFSRLKNDNGRCISFKGVVVMWVTELDLDIITRQYDADFFITDLYTATRGRFPEQFREIINQYFEAKETLKQEGGYFYMKSKNKLNSIYGMSVSAIIRDDIEYNIDTADFTVTKITDEKEKEKRLAKFYNSRNSFFPYQVGVWVTAQCRHELFKLIELIGYDKFVYSDTDSIFFTDSEEVRKKLKNYNQEIIEENQRLGLGIVKKDGSVSYYNLFEDEEDCIEKFRTLHAKCYAFENSKGELSCTIAGISKDNKEEKGSVSYLTNADELEKIDNLDNDFTFYDCGGTISKYVSHEIQKINIDGHITEISDACLIFKHEKTISTISDYDDIYDYERE